MFERFTDRARRVVVLAQEESRLLGHDHIGTEHLLLGLVGEAEGIAGRALAALQVDLDGVRDRVEGMIGRGAGASKGHIPFTPRAKKVLELSLREALQLGHSYIGTEHILLGLLREGQGVACQVLMNEGVTLNVARQEVIGQLSGVTGAEVEAVEGALPRAPAAIVERAASARLRRREGEPERSPVCPRCDADLGASLRYRIQDVPHGPEEAAPRRRAAILYCAECGRLVAANLLEHDPAEPSRLDDAGETDPTTEHEADGSAEPDAAAETG